MPKDPNRISALTKMKLERQELYLESLARWGRVGLAMREAGVACPTTLYDWREADETFRDRETQAMDDFKSGLQREVVRRGRDGVRRQLYHNGKRIGKEVVYSDRMLELAVKAFMPEFRDRSTIDINIRCGVLVVPAIRSEAEWLAYCEAHQRDPDPLAGLPGVNPAAIEQALRTKAALRPASALDEDDGGLLGNPSTQNDESV